MEQNNHWWTYECGHSILGAKKFQDLWITSLLDGLIVYPPDKLEQPPVKFLFDLRDSEESSKRRGRKPILSPYEMIKLKSLHGRRPRDFGMGLETRAEGWVWTVDLFHSVMRRLFPDKHFSRATADRLHREFKKSHHDDSDPDGTCD